MRRNWIQFLKCALAGSLLLAMACGGGGGGGGGSTTPQIQPPTGLTYSSNPAVYTNGVAITPNNPSSGGSTVTSYSVNPSLPSGLALNTSTGVITGTPTAVAATASYTITASNSAGNTTALLSITVNAALLPPSGLTYSINPAVYTNGVAISPNSPSSSGGAVTSYGVSPALPTGLNLNNTTGVITGTPTAVKATASYTVTATNSAGFTTVGLTITVNAAVLPPIGLTYSTNPAVYTYGVAITPNTPSSSGGSVTSYGVSPALPIGLSLNTSTGVITGTPTAVTTAASYTVTATNSAGFTTVGLTITVNAAVQPPTGLTYSMNPAIYTKGLAITANTPSSGGGAVASYGISPSLPAGLTINTSTGSIIGTPTAVTASASYTVMATNTGGSTTASLTITVNDAAPASLVYTTSTATYTVGVAITANSPSNGGGTVTSYGVSPALPSGLSLNTSTGVITGTPAAVKATGTYIVTATNSGGSTTAGLTITVNAAVTPPTGLTYSTNPAVYTKGVAITSNSPSSGGSAVVSYGVNPALPTGLNLNTTTGVITGTPTAVTATSSYSVTGTNSAGSTTASLTITVNDAAPSGLTYTLMTAVYTKGIPIPVNSPSNTGGTVLSYYANPSLPGGLSISASTGVISGTPTVVMSLANYAVIAQNSIGGTSVILTITVKDIPPASLVYTTPSAIYTKGVTIPTNTPSYSGGLVTSYSVSPSLPAGLALNNTTGVITGTPTTVTATTSYTITATNSGGSTTTSLTTTVNDVAPANLIYTNITAVYNVGTAIAPNSPSNTGGTATSYSVYPNLPAGLSLNTSNGLITGTPTAVNAMTSYSVTVTNSGGSTSASLNITVVPPGPQITIQPSGSYNMVGLTSTFSVTVTGSGPLTYQWQKNNSDISGATSSQYTTPAIQLSDNGATFCVSIQDTYGSQAKSNTVVLSVVQGLFSNTASLSQAVYLHTSTLLPNGSVLITGGMLSDGYSAISSAELYSPTTGLFANATQMNAGGRQSHTATLLPNGKVLITGGFSSSGNAVSQTEIYDPSTGIFSFTGAMVTPRGEHTATLLQNGKVLIHGGVIAYNNALLPPPDRLNSELYDPNTGTFTALSNVLGPRVGHTATLLNDGTVLITGGSVVSTEKAVDYSWLFDPVSETYGSLGALLKTARKNHTATLLPNGKVLISGGTNQNNLPLASAELYDPVSKVFSTTGSMSVQRVSHTATLLLPDGEVLIAGGWAISPIWGSSTNRAEVYDQTSGTFTLTGPGQYRYGHTATFLFNGEVLFVGGSDSVHTVAISEIYQYQ